MIGFNSQYPTLFVSESPLSAYFDKTGRIGIGNITAPEAKLHLYADEGEEAAVFIQPHNWANNEPSILMLGSGNSGITANTANGMSFLSEGNYLFNSGGFVGINTSKPEYNLHVNGAMFTKAFRLYDEHLPPKAGNILVSDDIGNGFWVDPNEYSLWTLSENGEDIYRSSGKVIIGDNLETPDGYRLYVEEGILTEELFCTRCF